MSDTIRAESLCGDRSDHPIALLVDDVVALIGPAAPSGTVLIGHDWAVGTRGMWRSIDFVRSTRGS